MTSPHGSPSTHGAHTGAPGAAAHPHAAGGTQVPEPTTPHGKQFVKFNFFRVRDAVRTASPAQRAEVGRCLVELLDRSSKRMLTRTYTTVGTQIGRAHV